MTAIQKVEVFFEPLGAVQAAMRSGAQVGIPLGRGIPAAIRTADQFLGMNGSLIAFSSGLNIDVQVIEEMSDPEWAAFIDRRTEGRWKRWSGETTQGRWNVVVYLL